MANVRLEKISKAFGKVQAVQPTSINFRDGQLSVLVGPSGCGKTTLMRMIAGLEMPTSGTISMNGERIDQTPAWGRDVAMVFQNYALYPHKTVFDNMAFPLIARGIARDKRKQRVQAFAEQLEIDYLLKRKPRELSGGQMQRVALGRALVRQPQVFLMDEPLSNLDAALRTTMRAEIKHLQRELGITTIYVTHDQTEAMTLADHLIVMNDGRIQQADAAETVYNQPKNSFVAQFIGNPPMNILPCQYDASVQALVIAGGVQINLPERHNAATIGYIGIRPEDVAVVPLAEAADSGTVYAIELLGREALLTLQLSEYLIKVVTPPVVPYQQHDRIGFVFPSSKLHFFDRDGIRLTTA